MGVAPRAPTRAAQPAIVSAVKKVLLRPKDVVSPGERYMADARDPGAPVESVAREALESKKLGAMARYQTLLEEEEEKARQRARLGI